jgi:hypothetical protein
MSVVVAFMLRVEIALDRSDVGTKPWEDHLFGELKRVMLASKSFDELSLLVRAGSMSDDFRRVHDRLCADEELVRYMLALGLEQKKIDPATAHLFASE